MKKIILFALICTSGLISCDNKKGAEPEIQFTNLDSKVAYRQSTVVSASGNDLTVNLKELADSRCPSNANCITMGSAELTLAITDGTENALVQSSFSGNGQNSVVQKFSLGSKSYALKITEVLPYPETSKKPVLEDYKIGVSIVKL
jgi:hypothetical protein